MEMKTFFKEIRLRRRLARLRQENEIVLADEDLPRVKLRIAGSGNRIQIGKLKPGSGELLVDICGTDCEVTLGEGIAIGDSLDIVVGQDHPNFGEVRACRVSIGADTSFGSASLVSYNSNSSIAIGEKCMVAFAVNIYNTDAHPIVDAATGKILNNPKDLVIGNHVWIGAHATILKNTHIADDSIVGWGSVVAGVFTRPNVAICGNPARIVTREGRAIDWKIHDPVYILNPL